MKVAIERIDPDDPTIRERWGFTLDSQFDDERYTHRISLHSYTREHLIDEDADSWRVDKYWNFGNTSLSHTPTAKVPLPPEVILAAQTKLSRISLHAMVIATPTNYRDLPR